VLHGYGHTRIFFANPAHKASRWRAVGAVVKSKRPNAQKFVTPHFADLDAETRALGQIMRSRLRPVDSEGEAARGN